MRLLAISGSLRAISSNTRLLRAIAVHAPAGVKVEIYANLGGLPIFNPDDEGERRPAAVSHLLDLVRACDGLIIASPEYAHGIPGGLKNALDWMVSSDGAVGKPAMLVHASVRSVHLRSHLSEVLRTMSFRLDDSAPLEIPLLGRQPAEQSALLADPPTAVLIKQALTAFVQLALHAKEP